MSNLFAAPADSSLPLVLAILIFILAGAVKGVLGFGMPTVAMALLGFMMKPQQAAALLIVPSLATNTWQAFRGPAVGPALRRFWLLLAMIIIGTIAGVVLLGTRLDGGATVLLGLVLVIYGVIGLASVPMSVPRRTEPWLSPLIGIATGLVNATTGVSVIPLVPYLHSLGLAKEDLVQVLGLSFLAAILALGTGLTLTLNVRLSALDLVLPLAASLGGMAAGQSLRRRISAETFRRWFFGALVVVGGYLALRAW